MIRVRKREKAISLIVWAQAHRLTVAYRRETDGSSPH